MIKPAVHELTSLAIEAKRNKAAYQSLQVKTLPLINPIARRYAQSFEDQVEGDIVNEFILVFRRYVSRFDHSKLGWPAFIRSRFRWHCQDWSRIRDNQPMGNYVTRGEVRFKVEELNAIASTPGERQSDFASRIVSRYRDYGAEAARFEELLNSLNLPPRIQQILTNYFVRNFTMKECAQDIGLSESRVCQLISTAFPMIRSKLQSLRWYGEF